MDIKEYTETFPDKYIYYSLFLHDRDISLGLLKSSIGELSKNYTEVALEDDFGMMGMRKKMVFVLEKLYPYLLSGDLKVELYVDFRDKPSLGKYLEGVTDQKNREFIIEYLRGEECKNGIGLSILDKKYEKYEAKEAIEEIQKRWDQCRTNKDKLDFEIHKVIFKLSDEYRKKKGLTKEYFHRVLHCQFPDATETIDDILSDYNMRIYGLNTEE
ncbi:MAG: hypothetical protein GY828_03450 [Candidatus Gracilibacteria bacterium]|nr:hypothetical protein [Candidatus Gracilibacteria bacterium]